MAFDAGHTIDLADDPVWRPRLIDTGQAQGYVTLGTRNLKRTRRFYDLIACEIGLSCSSASGEMVIWGFPGFGLAVSVGAPRLVEGFAPLQADDPDQVRRLYDIAISQGGACEGEPQDQGGGLYAAYFRDPEGNRLNAFCLMHN
jgi:catechol 2,3-dioxygenase-like lactoylglutathione lyase family enzyme